MSLSPQNLNTALVIDPDEFKKQIPNYNPASAE